MQNRNFQNFFSFNTNSYPNMRDNFLPFAGPMNYPNFLNSNNGIPQVYFCFPNPMFSNPNSYYNNQIFSPTNTKSKLPLSNSNNNATIYNNKNLQNNQDIKGNDLQKNEVNVDKDKEQKNEIKLPTLTLDKRREFLSEVYFNSNINLLNIISIEKKQQYFDNALNRAEFYYLQKCKFNEVDLIFLKKIDNTYSFDYYKFQDYKTEAKIELLKEALSNNLVEKNKDFYYKMKKEMEEECISTNKTIKLFIFNQYCFLEPQTISVYIPHILKKEHNEDFLTYFIKKKKLDIEDFVIDSTNNENCLFITIIRNRIRELINNNYMNNREYGLGVTKNGERGYLYTTIPVELIEQSILTLDFEDLNKQYKGGYYSEKSSTIKQSFISSTGGENIDFFEKNEDYVRGMSTQELILSFIHKELKEFNKLPRLIAYENLIDIKGNQIYKNTNLNFIEFDSIIESKVKFVYDNKKYPLLLQKSFEINNKGIIEREINNKTYFVIEKDSIYFFEIKTSINKDNLCQIISNIINNFQKFYFAFTSNNIIDNKTNFILVLIYDYHKINIEIKDFIQKAIEKKKMISISGCRLFIAIQIILIFHSVKIIKKSRN